MSSNLEVQNSQQFLGGKPAQRLLANAMNLGVLRTNALLRKDDWIEVDRRVVRVAGQQLNGIADLQMAGLILRLGGLGTTISQYEKRSDMTEASVNMDAPTSDDEDTLEYNLVGVPIPIVSKGFRLSIRRLEASRRMGDALDTAQIEVSTRLVIEKLEALLFGGAGFAVDSNNLYGYTNHPDRNTGTLAGAWTGAGAATILDDVLAMIDEACADGFYGPYNLYIPKNYWTLLQDDYKAESDKTRLSRILEIQELNAIKPTEALTGNNVVLVQMTADVVDLAVAQDVTTVEWDEKGGLVEHFKVMAAMAPRIKSDANGDCGVVHYSV